jgi:hypothetical protein
MYANPKLSTLVDAQRGKLHISWLEQLQSDKHCLKPSVKEETDDRGPVI